MVMDIRPSGTNIRPRGTTTGRVGYQYVVLRCVPRVERGEFVNVGIVLFVHETGDLYAAHDLDTARILALDPTCDIEGVRDQLRRVQDVCLGLTGRGLPTFERPGQRFGWLKAPRSTVVQPGPVHGGVTDNPVGTLQDLMRDLVLPPA